MARAESDAQAQPSPAYACERLAGGAFRLRRDAAGDPLLEAADGAARRHLGLRDGDTFPVRFGELAGISAREAQRLVASLERSARELVPWVQEWAADTPAGRRVLHAVAMPAQRSADASVVWDGLLVDVSAARAGAVDAPGVDVDYQSVFENTTEGIFRSSRDGRLLDANWPLVRMHGCSSKEELLAAVGNVATDWYVWPVDRERIMAYLDGHGSVERFEADVRRVGTGEIIRTEENVRAVHGGDGRLLYYQGTVRDITQEYRQRRLAGRRSDILERIARGDMLTEILYDTVGALEDFGHQLTAAVLRVDDGQIRVAAAPALANDCIAVLDGARPSLIGGAVAQSMQSGERSRQSRAGACSADFAAAKRAAGYGELVVAPARAHDGAVLGLLAVFLRDAGDVDSDLAALLHEMAQIVAIALEQHALTSGLVRQAQYDALTQLPNRDLLADRAQQLMLDAGRNDHPLAVLLLDLDAFKQVNDTLGHAAGDILLREVAARLQACVRGTDTVARLGGDEFVIAASVATPGCAELVAERVIAALGDPFRIQGQTAFVTPSIGIALFPQDGLTLDQLLQAADAAMYAAKRAGKGRFEYFNQDLSAAVSERLQLEAALHEALAAGTIITRFQPRRQLADGRINAAEAVPYWHHPDRGLVPVAEVVALADHSDTVTALHDHLLRDVLKHVDQGGAGGAALPLAVELPARLLQHDAAARDLAQRIGVGRASRVEIGVAEELAVRDRRRLVAVLRELRERLPEVGLALDRFGRGECPLRCLIELPLDTIRLDGALVARLAEEGTGSQAGMFVRAVTDLARARDLRVVARDVTTSAQVAALREVGCGEASGPCWGEPVAAEALFASDCP